MDTPRGPRNTSEGELSRVGIEEASQGSYRCTACGGVWSPMLGAGGRLPRGWWHCPDNCNLPEANP